MRTILIMMFLLAGMSSSAAREDTMSASELLEVCSQPSTNWIDFCNGYFQAIYGIVAANGQACAPNGTSRTDLVELYEREAHKAIQGDGTIGDQPAVWIATIILIDAYPCK